ncbi:LEM-3-like GIY-YIG domain-containing protein [Winogradskyella sp. A3E31]|uniref:LEM-3-like GIY-YIG domain-containing protein n=1 Tax=Winogradskyella sp. A3E31 TaxID=3349637 RepID=UPI00398A718C
MNKKQAEYYVYVYIDPRNFEEFYYGKGKGNRKLAHLTDASDTEKTKRIKAIYKEGLKPIIKVIAKDLTEKEAFLIEKTLIWKLGKNLTNQSSGHFAEKFRPHDTLHLDLAHFDFKNGLYFLNVGEGIHRCWEDSRKYGFISAGQHPKYSNPIRTLKRGDIITAFVSTYGYVGIGRVVKEAVRVNDFKVNGKQLSSLDLKVPNIFDNCENENSEFPIKIEWIKSVDKKNAKWKPKSGLYSPQLVKASLEGQPKTVKFLEEEFDINIRELMLTE